MARGLVVVGDALLDRDVAGAVTRVSPDAPVPVFDEQSTRDRVGGAALAAALAAGDGPGDGQPVRLVSAVGRDPAGARLRELLAEAGVELIELPYGGGTPEKIRLCTDRQVVLRLDRAGLSGGVGEPGAEALAALAGASAILVSDYGRGVTGLSGLRRVLAGAAQSRPVVWDPHRRGTSPVPGVRLATPNESEVDKPAGDIGLRGIATAAAQARQAWRCGAVAVTLGAEGALLTQGGNTPLVVPPPVRCSGDSCGAGDRFASAATAALARGALVSEAVQVAVCEAARFVQAGAARTYPVENGQSRVAPGVGLPEALAIAERTRAAGGTVVATGGCFDLVHPGHVATLQAARGLGDCLVVCVNSDASVRSLKGPDRPLLGEQDRAQLLAALSCVDAVVIFDESTPLNLLSRLRPDIWVKGGDYFVDDPENRPVLPEASHVRAWGGQTVVVPYRAGHSTTSLIEAARGTSGGGDE
jgi:D-beta-D-heptose 7-phosphate kinase / D-beta-D-heptose 1-phosphate adenosyltransferase